MDDLQSEKEQIEQIRNWWSEYGWYVVGGVVLGVVLLVGYNQHQSKTLATQLDASARYEALTQHVVDGDIEEAEAIVEDLSANFAGTTYVAQANIAMARLYMDRNRDQDASDALQSVVDSEADEALRHVARLRLARIYLYQEKAQDVVDMLSTEDDPSFAAAYGEILGDAYAALGNIGAAQSEYEKVLADPLAQGTVNLTLVQWKLLDLPEQAAAAGLPEPEVGDTVETEEVAVEESE